MWVVVGLLHNRKYPNPYILKITILFVIINIIVGCSTSIQNTIVLEKNSEKIIDNCGQGFNILLMESDVNNNLSKASISIDGNDMWLEKGQKIENNYMILSIVDISSTSLTLMVECK